MKVYTIPCHDRGHINVMSVLQSCTDPLRILPSLSSDTYATSSYSVCHIGNMKVDGDFEMQGEEGEGEVNVKREKGIASEEEDCIIIKDEEGIYSEEEEDIDVKEEEDVVIKDEVRIESTV